MSAPLERPSWGRSRNEKEIAVSPLPQPIPAVRRAARRDDGTALSPIPAAPPCRGLCALLLLRQLSPMPAARRQARRRFRCRHRAATAPVAVTAPPPIPARAAQLAAGRWRRFWRARRLARDRLRYRDRYGRRR